jgi:eukaryotic-like serine/threonine-protein kinase
VGTVDDYSPGYHQVSLVMAPDYFQRVEELFHSALEASAGERAALLEQADPDLRREVESLLASSKARLILDRSVEWPGDPLDTGLNPGARLGPYQVECKLGEGGMGEVFRAVDTRLGRSVAIKLVHEHFSARFEREARAISALNHPHICTLYDIGPNYLVMELLEGETLATRLKNGPLPVDQARRCATQIVAALAEAHEHGIVHRDLKPGNIMLVKSGVKILDFGLAAHEGEDTLTGRRMVFGTPAYMAPEQREGNPPDARTDIYSFGCVFHEMLTGACATSDRKAIPSKTLEKIVIRCLEREPAQRWQTAVELANALDAPLRPQRNRFRIVFSVALLGAALIASFFYFRPAPRLTDRDTIVLADFTNSTGDPIFDGTLRQGLAIQLEQSPFLKIMDDQQVQNVLGRMSLSPGSRITNPIAHEICLRDGAAATIDGMIANLGKSYVITLQAIACQDGATLAREQIQAVDKEHVLSALGRAATAMRGKLGESRKSIQKLDRPLEQATTSSLEALQNYTAGVAELSQGRFLNAVPLLERATAIDPNFAMAYAYLGGAFEVAGDTMLTRKYTTQAFRVSEHVSEFERNQIAGRYYGITGEVHKEINAWESNARNYPRRWEIHNQLGLVYIDNGQYEEGLKASLKASEVQPLAEPPYRRQLDAYMCLDQILEARRVGQTVRKLGIDGARIHQRLLEIAYIEGDRDAADRETQWYAGKPEEYLSFGLQAANLNVLGRRRESSKLYRRAAETALRGGLRDVAASFEEADARADALSDNCGTARQLGRPALALAICGDASQAERIAGETSRLFPNGTLWNTVQLPGIRAAIELRRGQPAEAVELLASASPYERAYPEAAYLRGLAYLRLHKGVEAAAEFRKIVDHKGASWGSDWRHPYWGQFYSLSHLGMARGFTLAGDAANARKAFQGFFELWKNADSDIPILRQAKAEYNDLR